MRKTKKQKIRAGLLSLALVFTLTGCGHEQAKKAVTKTTKVKKQTTTTAQEKPKNTKAFKAVKTAIRIYKEHPKYSQAKRMQKGYIDCSAYVWKCWKAAGISFGESSYAPTAAEIARWCEENHCLISEEKAKNHLEPGDLIFYANKRGNNGRFKNIAHVSIYIGNGKMLHADGASPAYGNPWYRKVAAVGRPAR